MYILISYSVPQGVKSEVYHKQNSIPSLQKISQVRICCHQEVNDYQDPVRWCRERNKVQECLGAEWVIGNGMKHRPRLTEVSTEISQYMLQDKWQKEELRGEGTGGKSMVTKCYEVNWCGESDKRRVDDTLNYRKEEQTLFISNVHPRSNTNKF